MIRHTLFATHRCSCAILWLAVACILYICGSGTRAQVAPNEPSVKPRAGTIDTKPTAKKKANDVPAVGNQRLELSGNLSFPDDDLRVALASQFRELEEGDVTPAKADDAAYYLGVYYRKQGFANVEVTFSIPSANRVLLKIAEGPRTLIGDVRFQGNKQRTKEQLLPMVLGKEFEKLAIKPELFPYNASEAEESAKRLLQFYQIDGFLDAIVILEEASFSTTPSRAVLTYSISEGLRYVFGKTSIKGDLVLPMEKLRAVMEEEPVDDEARTPRRHDAKPFTPGRAEAMRRDLQTHLRDAGYYKAEVSMTTTRTPNSPVVPVEYSIQSGALYRFDGVLTTNKTDKPRLAPDFVEKRVRALRGMPYDAKKVDDIYREMLRTGLFQGLRVKANPVENDQMRLEFEFEEARAKEVGFTIGFASYEGFNVGVRASDRNLFGKGRPLSLIAAYTQRGLSGEILYQDPWLFDSAHKFKARLFSQTREELGYEKNETGLRLDLGRNLTPKIEIGAFWEAKATEITALSIDPTLIGNPKYTLTTLGFAATLDFRVGAPSTRAGWIFSSGFDLGLVDGQHAFNRATFRISHYQPIGKMLLATGFRAGYIAPVVEPIPIDIGFFNGGATTVRSFTERQLGPKDKAGNPLGGDSFTVLNCELIFPIKGALRGAAFVDAGNVQSSEESGFGDMRYAVGLGLRYDLPIGPLRLDYGFNPSPKADEDIGAFHFSFGFAF